MPSPPRLRLPRPLLAPARRTRRRGRVVFGRSWDWVVDRFDDLGLSQNAILLGFAVVVGAGTALGVVGFYKLIDLAYTVLFRWTPDYFSNVGLFAYRPVLTACGFAAAWWIMRRLGRATEGLNVPDVQLAVAKRGGDIPPRPALARTAASAVTLGSGGSAGAEGPVAVLGAAIGSFLGRAFRFAPGRTKVMVGAGAAAGISAAFNAPLAGAFFALEEILGSFAVGSFPPVVVASVIAAVVSHAFLGRYPAFPIPAEYGYELTREVLVFYPILGIVAGLVAVAFVRTYFGTERLIRRLPVRPALVPWVGGAIVGGIVVLSNGLLVGHGHFAVHLELFGRLPWTTLALLSAGNILATSLTLNTGGSGGLFTPSLYVGATAGGAFGVILTDLFPTLGLSPEAYALVGMGAVVAASTGAPITGILLVFEMTNDYNIVLPLMLTVVIAHLVARRLEPDNLYSGWLRRRGENLEQGTDRDVMTRLRVADAFERSDDALAEDAPVAHLLDQLATGRYVDYPVIDAERRLVGIVTVADLGRLLKEDPESAPQLVAADIAVPVEAAAPDDSLLSAIRRMGVRGASVLPVVDPRTGVLLGVVSRAHILALYERTVAGTPG